MNGVCRTSLLSRYIYSLIITRVSFRQVPAFGETTIRRFEGDVSEMKRLTGHDFEDLLQVSWYLATSRWTPILKPSSA